MSKDNPVPKLDLAPKLKRPLSLWNPWDYLRLLYWVFYFPQALRWYIDTFGGGYIEPTSINWRKRWKLILQNQIQRNLQIQESILIILFPLILGGLLLLVFRANSSKYLPILIGGSIIFGLLLNILWDVGFGIAGGIGLSIHIGFLIILRLLELKIAFYILANIIPWSMFGLILNISLSMTGRILKRKAWQIYFFSYFFSINLHDTASYKILLESNLSWADIRINIRFVDVIFNTTLPIIFLAIYSLILGWIISLIFDKIVNVLNTKSQKIKNFFLFIAVLKLVRYSNRNEQTNYECLSKRLADKLVRSHCLKLDMF